MLVTQKLPKNKQAASQIIAIDVLRAFAALGVFYYHSHIGALLVKYTNLSFLGYTDLFGAIYAVPLFFLLSGYCIHASNVKYIRGNKPLPLKEYYFRRFWRIYPPYFVAVLFAVAAEQLVQQGSSINKMDLIVHLFSLQGLSVTYFNTINVVLWTITVELEFYILYPVFYYLRRRYSLNTAIAIALLVSIISIGFFISKGNISLPERYCVLNIWFAWCCGAFLADKRLIDPTALTKRVYIIIYTVILIGFYLTRYLPDELVIITYQLRILIWTAPMMFLISREAFFRKWNHLWIVKVFAAVGLSSYSLYLFHEPLTNLKNLVIHQYFPAALQPVLLIAGIVVIPVITFVSYYYIERPFMKKKNNAAA
jgi:peptidoglycan/LPS O-acetylase OafA/YrhL